MNKILIGGAGGAPSEGVIRSLLFSDKHEEIIGMGSVPSDLIMSQASRKYVVPYANEPAYEEKLLKILELEHPTLIHFQNDFEIYYASKIRNDIQATGTKIFMPDHSVIDTCVSKWKSWIAFKDAGITVPENIFINNEDDLKRAFKELGNEEGKIWLRAESMGGGGMGSIPTNDYEMAKAWINRYDGWGCFIAAQMLTSNTFTWLSIWFEGELVVAQTRKRSGWIHGNRSASGVTGVTKVGTTCSDELVTEVAKKTVYAVDKKPLSRQIAKNYAEAGVRVNCICPGIIDTPILGDRDRDEYAKRIPLGYVGKPEDVANVVAFLASDQASYITGAVLPVDGGGISKLGFFTCKKQIEVPLDMKIDFDRICTAQYFKTLTDKTVLITGANGFVGTYLSSLLAYANDYYGNNNRIILMMRNPNNLSSSMIDIVSRTDIKIVVQDIREDILLPRQVDYIIHAATTSDSKKIRENGIDVIDSAFNGTKKIIEYASRAGVESAIYLSSITVLGNVCDAETIDEQYCGKEKWNEPLSCYTYGKRVSEYMIFESANSKGLPIKIIRPGYVFGASSKKDSRVYAGIIKAASENEVITLYSSRNSIRPNK